MEGFRLEDAQWAFGPNLQQFSFQIGPESDNYPDYENDESNARLLGALQLLFRSCPKLESLKFIPDDIVHWPMNRALSPTLVLPKLKVFDLCSNSVVDNHLDTPPQVIRWSSAQPSLTELKLTLNYMMHHSQDDLLAFHEGFSIQNVEYRALEDLHLSVTHLTEVQMFIQMVKMPKLQSLSTQVYTMFTGHQFAELIEMLPRHLAVSNLKSLTIEIDYDIKSRPAKGYVSRSTIGSLLQARNLTTLKIRSNLSFEVLCRATLAQMAAIWQNLESLTLLGPQDTYEIGLSDVTNFARACPRLKKLGLQFDASDILADMDENALIENGQLIALEELCVGLSRIVDAQPVADFVRTYFPNLKKLKPEYIIIHGKDLASRAQHATFETWCKAGYSVCGWQDLWYKGTLYGWPPSAQILQEEVQYSSEDDEMI